MLNNMFEVRYVLYAQANGIALFTFPKRWWKSPALSMNIAEYLRDLRQRLYEAYFRRTLDQVAANRFVEDTWRKLKLPDYPRIGVFMPYENLNLSEWPFRTSADENFASVWAGRAQNQSTTRTPAEKDGTVAQVRSACLLGKFWHGQDPHPLPFEISVFADQWANHPHLCCHA